MAAGAGAPSWRSLTVGRGDSGAPGLAAVTWTREVSFFGFGASTGRLMTDVSLFASSSGDTGGPGGLFCGAGTGAGVLGGAPRPVKPGGRLMRTVSFFNSSAGLCGMSSAMVVLRKCWVKDKRVPAELSNCFSRMWLCYAMMAFSRVRVPGWQPSPLSVGSRDGSRKGTR